MFRYALLFVLLPIALATRGWRPCNGVPSPLSVDIEGCDQPPCILPRGKNIYMESTYVSEEFVGQDGLSTYSDFHELGTGIKGNFPLPENTKNTCKNMVKGRCPVYPDEEVTYSMSMPVLVIYPKNFDLDLTIYVQNERTVNQTCFHIVCRTSG